MEGLLLLISCIGIGLLASWMMQNNRVGPRDRTIGLFAMPSTDSDEPGDSTEPRGTRRWRTAGTHRKG